MRSSVRLLCSLSISLATAAAGSLLLLACGGVGDADTLFNSGGTTSGAGGATGTSASSGKASSTGSTMVSSSASGASSSVASSGSGSLTENCLDGIDNNGDGLVDCADPQCQAGFQCVDDDPVGWKGHFYVTQTPLPAGPAPMCPSGLDPATGLANPAGPAQCTACSCGALQGATCSAPGIDCWPGSATCNGGQAQDWTPTIMDGACHKPTNLLGLNIALSCKISSPPLLSGSGSCAPSAVDFPNKAPFQQRIDACGASKVGGGCGATQVCVPKGSGNPTESVCVRADGAQACPAGWGKAITAYADGVDTRACTACTCGAAAAKCSDATYTFYDLDACATGGGSDNPIPVSANTCTNLSALLDQGSWSENGQVSKATGSCPASGGLATGSVQPQKPVTYCCK